MTPSCSKAERLGLASRLIRAIMAGGVLSDPGTPSGADAALVAYKPQGTRFAPLVERNQQRRVRPSP